MDNQIDLAISAARDIVAMSSRDDLIRFVKALDNPNRLALLEVLCIGFGIDRVIHHNGDEMAI